MELFELFHDDRCSYLLYGREVGEQGTPHLQGYVVFESRRTLQFVRNISPNAHWETRRGSARQAIDYCKKDGQFEEFGQPPVEPGHRSDIDRYKVWLKEQATPPSERDIAEEFTSLYMRYPKQCIKLSKMLCPPLTLEDDNAKEWQRTIIEACELEAPKREICFCVDLNGGVGKSWLMRKLISVYPDAVQVMGIGKRDDLAYAIDETRRIFIFDVPRGAMEFLCYDFLEKLKDRVVFSPKYESLTKILKVVPHVIVFCNEYPDMNKMTGDRYLISDNFAE